MKRSPVLAIIFVFVVTLTLAHTAKLQLKVLHEWKNLPFSFDSKTQEEEAIKAGWYMPDTQKRPYDADADRSGRKFISIPRVSEGVPYTLAVVDEQRNTTDGPLLRPYPNMDFHFNSTCDMGIISVFRIRVEPSCNRLWVMDTGRDFFVTDGPTLVCPPKIVVFNLASDKVEFQQIIPSSQYNAEESVFNSITVLSGLTCKDSIAYLSDARGDTGLVVYDHRRRIFTSPTWLTRSVHYKAEPGHMNTTIANESFIFPDGLYTVAPNIVTGQLYFHAFASLSEISIPLKLINNPYLWENNRTNELFFRVLGQRPTQSASEVVDSVGNIWFSQLQPLAIYSWNPLFPYNKAFFRNEIIDEQNLQFVAGLKIDCHRRTGENLLGLSNRLQKHNTGTVNSAEINYRMFSIPIRDASSIGILAPQCWN